MTEEELIDLGFDQVYISDAESQNGYDYYFYQKEICDNIVLYSTDSDSVVDNNWALRCWDIPAIRIYSRDHYLQFLEMINTITC